jgi:hypothetical protein
MASYEGNLMLSDVIEYILAHKDDMAAMDRINRATYPFTTKFQEKVMGIQDDGQPTS